MKGEQNKPLVTLTYETQAKAKDARGMMAKVIEGAAVFGRNAQGAVIPEALWGARTAPEALDIDAGFWATSLC